MKMLRRIMLGIGCAALVALLLNLAAPRATHALVAALVQVTNTTANPVPVSDVVAQQAYAVSCESELFIRDSLNECGVVVPAGQRFIIRSISMQVEIDTGVTVAKASVRTPNPNADNVVWFNVPHGAISSPGFDEFQTTQPAYAYADGGTNVTCAAFFTASPQNNNLNCSFFGYLVPQP